MIKKTTKPEEDQPKKMCNCRNETEEKEGKEGRLYNFVEYPCKG